DLAITKELCGTLTYTYKIDLTNSTEIKSQIALMTEQVGKLNGFVHCAGRPYVAPLKVLDENKALDIYKLNSYAAIELAKCIVNKKVYAGEYGSIVLISSVYGVVGSAANVGYAMTKGAIQSITKALAIELASKKIRVNCIVPGFVKTEMADEIHSMFPTEYQETIEKMHPLGWGCPDDIAAGIAYLFSDMSKWVTGSILTIDGGFTAQ
ncbi:MAG: SDR family oxidoreductase, partial [Longicatena sp.]